MKPELEKALEDIGDALPYLPANNALFEAALALLREELERLEKAVAELARWRPLIEVAGMLDDSTGETWVAGLVRAALACRAKEGE